jgi:hypothetical protein
LVSTILNFISFRRIFFGSLSWVYLTTSLYALYAEIAEHPGRLQRIESENRLPESTRARTADLIKFAQHKVELLKTGLQHANELQKRELLSDLAKRGLEKDPLGRASAAIADFDREHPGYMRLCEFLCKNHGLNPATATWTKLHPILTKDEARDLLQFAGRPHER